MRILFSIAGLFFLFPFTPRADGQEWTRFRGPNGSGLSDATTVPVKWTDDDYNWKIELPGLGHSSPVLWGHKLFITSGDEETGARFVLCIDAASGRRLWQRDFAAEPNRKHQHNSFASGSPAVDDQRVYVCWTDAKHFVVMALDHDGRDVWQKQFDPFKSGHGDGVSPIVHDGAVVLPLERDAESSAISLDAASGEVRWQVARESSGNWATPCVLLRGKTAEFIFADWKTGITAIDAKTGRTNWQADVFNKGHVESSISSPIIAGDLVLGTSGWMGVRQEVIAVRPKTVDSELSAERLYCIDKGAPLCVTPIVRGGLLFVWSDEGVVTCADVATGQVHWRKRVDGPFYSSPICIQDRLYNITREGLVIVIAAEKEFKELARIPLGEATHSTPAVANGTMYLRTYSHLMAVGGQ